MNGPGWMDHQWGDVTRRDIGWDWASIQMDDGSDLMVAVIWHPDGRRRLAGHGTYLEPDGDVTHYDEDDISITPLGAWVSPETGVEYPSGWRGGGRTAGTGVGVDAFCGTGRVHQRLHKSILLGRGGLSVRTARGSVCNGLGFRGTGGLRPEATGSYAQTAAAVVPG